MTSTSVGLLVEVLRGHAASNKDDEACRGVHRFHAPSDASDGGGYRKLDDEVRWNAATCRFAFHGHYMFVEMLECNR